MRVRVRVEPATNEAPKARNLGTVFNFYPKHFAEDETISIVVLFFDLPQLKDELTVDSVCGTRRISSQAEQSQTTGLEISMGLCAMKHFETEVRVSDAGENHLGLRECAIESKVRYARLSFMAEGQLRWAAESVECFRYVSRAITENFTLKPEKNSGSKIDHP